MLLDRLAIRVGELECLTSATGGVSCRFWPTKATSRASASEHEQASERAILPGKPRHTELLRRLNRLSSLDAEQVLSVRCDGITMPPCFYFYGGRVASEAQRCVRSRFSGGSAAWLRSAGRRDFQGGCLDATIATCQTSDGA